MNKLYRSNIDKKIGGLCGGIGEYLSISPDIIRVAFVIGVLILGFHIALTAYIVGILLVPQAPDGYKPPIRDSFSFHNSENKSMIGMIFIASGLILTIKKILHIDDVVILSIVLIALGVYIITKGGDKS